jgi:hypothetical protein
MGDAFSRAKKKLQFHTDSQNPIPPQRGTTIAISVAAGTQPGVKTRIGAIRPA